MRDEALDMMDKWREIGEITFLGNTLTHWVVALAIFLVTFTVLPIIKGYISARRRKWIQSNTELPAAIQIITLLIDRTKRLFLWTLAVYLASQQLELPPRVERAFDVVMVLSFWLQVGLWGMTAVRFAINRRSERANEALKGSIEIVMFVAGLLLWGMVFLLALDNLGVEIKPLLAGLGIGGIAVALAVQNVLGDLLASMSIALDKPFVAGEFIAVDDFMGTVEHIGVKSTRLRSLSGEQIYMSNADILKSRIRNQTRKWEQRIVFTVGVSYDTPADLVRQVPPLVRSIIESQEKTRFDRCHFMNLADAALQFETVYFVTVSDFNTYADIQQEINLAILQKFRDLGIPFAVQRPKVQFEMPVDSELIVMPKRPDSLGRDDKPGAAAE